jgi:hypothetical protein
VTDQEFVNRAHTDGYGVHVWTINEPAEMNMLLDWGVDGIMTAEPIRLEEVLCERGVARPARPAGAPGEHCSEKGSIACDVEPAKAKLSGKRLAVTVTRDDEFDARCAGIVKVRAAGKRAKGRFDFGDVPPSGGGPAKAVAKLRLAKRARAAVAKAGSVKPKATPYLAFGAAARLDVG